MTEVASIESPRRSVSLIAVAGIAVAALLLGGLLTWLTLGWLRPEPAPQPVIAVAPPSRTIVPPAASDPAALATRQVSLAAEVATLEQRTAQVSGEAATSAAYANRAEGLMVAFAARRAIDSGLGLGYLEQQLRDRFGTVRPAEVATIIRAARSPVTAEDLRLGLDTIGPQLAFGPGKAGWLSAFRRQLASMIVIHEQGMPSPAPGERLDRIRRLLGQRQVEAAMAEVDRLPNGAQATRWKAAAKQFVDAHEALDTLEATALQGGAATPAPKTR
jgi:hypothetical protein